ncbi:23229_t:CDS:1 [Cetraspora pellucida]|uniref:23229_t:CDS:1 n=1 Tax=Cetraspora pellucida TaxID=1433469 RepID=A0A9N9NV55_9GLOM|nr:23229_t:CDS:1 [Cetraspora pellucida]
MMNAQEWLDQTYQKEIRKEVKLIKNDDTKELSGKLLLDDFNNLVELNLSRHNLTNLDISDCYELRKLVIDHNSLTRLLNYPRDLVNPEKLTYLNVMNNNFAKIDLNHFSRFINLETLLIGTDDRDKIEQGFYNRFYGHLRSLKHLTKLKALDICGTDISKGLCHLPDSLKDFFCEVYRPEAKVAKIKRKLEPFEGDVIKYKKDKLKKVPHKKFVKNDELEEFQEQSVKIKNLLIVGRTGNGKSALANVLSDTNRFEESEKSVSKTKYFQTEMFEHNGKMYRVVDTIGIGDTILSKKQVLIRIAEAIYTMKEGINQILFVVGRRFTEDEMEAFELLKEVIFESDIIMYTTIVRTNFTNFRSPDKCEIDRQELVGENKFLAEIIKSCNGIIHVNNPPIDVDYEERLLVNKDDREVSRNKLLTHLDNFQVNYKPYLKTWDQFYLKIRNYLKTKHDIEEAIQRLSISSEEVNKLKAKIEKLEAKVVRETEFHCDVEIPCFGRIKMNFRSSNGICQII